VLARGSQGCASRYAPPPQRGNKEVALELGKCVCWGCIKTRPTSAREKDGDVKQNNSDNETCLSEEGLLPC